MFVVANICKNTGKLQFDRFILRHKALHDAPGKQVCDAAEAEHDEAGGGSTGVAFSTWGVS